VIPRPREVPPAEPAARRPRLTAERWFAGSLAIGLFWLAYEDGGSGLTARSVLAIGAWWALIIGVGFGLLPRARVDRAVIVVAALLAALAVHTFASTFWASDPAGAFNEFNRVALYLGLFLLVSLSVRRHELGWWADGLALGLSAVGAVALVSRLFPDLFSSRGLPEFLPNTATRLSFPVGYWNGLAFLMAMTLPFCLRGALTAQTRLRRSLAIFPAPILAAVIYLTSSRGGVAAAIVAAVVFLAATNRRWEAAGALLAAGLGAGAAIAVLVPRTELVNGPLDSSTAHAQGRVAALLILVSCVVAVAAYGLGTVALAGRRPPSLLAGRIVIATGVLAIVATVFALHPVRRFEEFKRIPSVSAAGTSNEDFVRAHLLSGNSSGRWQFWASAIDEFETAPVRGRGAASYEAWWAQHGSFTYFLRNAHSLYLEVLGELGLIGLALLVAALVAGLVAGVRRLSRASPGERPTMACFISLFAAFAFGAAVDWVWQITVVAGLGIVGLALSISSTARLQPASAPAQARERHLRFAAGTLAVISSWLVICAQAIPWLASIKLADSQAAVRRGEGDAAFVAAADARRIQPWAASPYLQLALVDEASGRLAHARRWIEKAIARDDDNWRLWLVAARLATKAGDIEAAARSLQRAAALNPRSPLFSDLGR
jgi:hypothetical protein